MHDNAQYALCRTFGHDWDILEESEFDDSMLQVWKWVFVLRCVRCTMKRIDGINAYGEVAQRSYHPPVGYRYSKDDPTPSRPEFRVFVAKNVLKGGTQMRKGS
jgi:hypothetical protein